MTRARFSVGIDLGTTNCVLAFVPLDGAAKSDVLAIPQLDSPTTVTEAPALPSFLYLPQDSAADGWAIGRFARARAAESPGRVVQSAKSWLAHHAADRSSPFLPWGSEDVTAEAKISPLRASALILSYLRDAWNARFAGAGAGFDSQAITITVPASFDAVAQRLTLAAADEAGFPDTVRLLEEPQAAFYRWLEQHDADHAVWAGLFGENAGIRHVLVVDVGGGTSDFSLFALRPHQGSGAAGIERIAVSDHILLGGDNMDLALAHRLEPQLVAGDEGLSAVQWGYLVARCRDVKERALSGEGAPGEDFAVSIPGRGSSLIGGARTARIARAEIEKLLLDGFFPECVAGERPLRTRAALGEWGLPYAADPGITRHLADFLEGRPAVDAVLFNGGALHAQMLRRRIAREIGKWQGRPAPIVLENPDPDFAVARGAARFGKIVRSKAQRIEAGSAHAVFLEAHRTPAAQRDALGERSLVCILPKDAPSEAAFEIRDVALDLRIDRPVRFQAYSSARLDTKRAGDVVAWNERDFQALPPLETVARVAKRDRVPSGRTVPVSLSVRLNALGLLQLSCVSADPAVRQAWPLEFDLRPQSDGAVAPDATANVAAGALEAGRRRIESLFGQPLDRRDRLTAGRLIKSLETIFGLPKSDWNVVLIRALWSTLHGCMPCRRTSVEHEEAWLILAGFLLRPGYGAALDDLRIDELWALHESGPCFPAKMVKLQEYILWRRVAGGLSRERQESLLAPELAKILQSDGPPAELVLLAGSLERIGHETKAGLIERLVGLASAHAEEKKHSAHFFAALGSLLNRAPLYAGPETVVSPHLVERAFEAFSGFDWADPKLTEAQVLFLRAARVVNNRSLDVSKSVRNRIADKLERSGVPLSKTAALKEYVPLERSERVTLSGESLPPGLILREGR